MMIILLLLLLLLLLFGQAWAGPTLARSMNVLWSCLLAYHFDGPYSPIYSMQFPKTNFKFLPVQTPPLIMIICLVIYNKDTTDTLTGAK